MTDQKTFKQRVRARMERTGESYTTARRQLLPELDSEREFEGLLPGVERTGGIHGDTAVIANAFAQAGVKSPHDGEPFSEAMLFGLSGGIGFMYFVFEYKGNPPMLSYVTRSWSLPDELVENAVARTGVQAVVSTTGSANVARTALHDALAAERVAICCVDPVMLPYLGLPAMWAGNDAQLVGVVGKRGSSLWLDDRCLQPNTITMEEFEAARASHKKSKQRLVYVEGQDAEHDLAASIREAVADTARSFVEPRFKSYAGNFGFSGLEKWRDLLTDETDKKGWRTLFASPAHAIVALKRTYECARYHVTPPAGGRPLYADFLDEAAPIVGDEKLAEAAALLRKSAVLWDEIADLALPEGEDELGQARRVVEELHDILREEGSRGLDDVVELRVQLAVMPGKATIEEDLVFPIYDKIAERVDGILGLEREALGLLA